ncbi:MAG: hypothetical protein P1R58_10000 [bacterium]|nr:hypothetical protein [bacterium]
MFRRSEQFSNMNRIWTISLVTLVALIVCATGVLAQQATRASVSIGKSWGSGFGVVETLSIDLNYDNVLGDSLEVAGFDFLIRYDPVPLTFVSAEPGQLFADCGWEYFNYRADTLGYARIVGVAEINNGDVHPACLADSANELARLNFMTPALEEGYECQYLPVEFWWADCGDNVVSGPAGDTLYVSNRVFQYTYAWQDITSDQPLPSQYGAPEVCVSSSGGVIAPERAVDFYHGGIDIICIDSIDDRGDINLNGIANEIADWVLFTNYFFYGPTVFTVNWEAQIAATDVNADGVTLTLNDLVYIYRIVLGDAFPFPSPAKAASGDTVVLVQDVAARTITINYTDSLSALMLYFDSDISILTSLPEHSIGGPDSLTSKVMIFPDLGGQVVLPLLPDGLVIEYSGDGNLVGALAAYDGLTYLETRIEGSGISTCCSIRGDVDHSGDMVQISDLVALVKYLFIYDSGFVPPCPEEANVDGLSGTADLSDLIYLIDYMFHGGAPIPPCPVR